MAINNVNLCGRITKDIEIRMTTNGKKVTKFNLAVQRTKEEADFITCQAWEKTAELLERYVKKGDRINVQGSIRTSSYETNNGKVYQTYVLVNQIELLESKNKQNTDDDFSNTPSIDINSDDLPFY